MTTYTLTITEEQALYIERACEALARIGMGQFDAAVLDNAHNMPALLDNMSEAREMLHQVTDLIGGGRYYRHGGPSITNSEVPNMHRTAWDVCQVIRHQLALDDPESRGSMVAMNKPLRCGDSPLPTIEEKS